MKIDPNLIQFAAPHYTPHVQAVLDHGGVRAAARAIGVHHASVLRALRDTEQRAAARGYSRSNDVSEYVPDGFKLKGVSVLLSPSVLVKQQWVKTTADEQRQAELFEQMLNEMCEGIKGLSPTVAAPTIVDDDLLTVYPIGDQHHGMYSDSWETGADWDCAISSGALQTAVAHLAAISPPSGEALLINLGDMFHMNDSSNVTQSGHLLDVDTRYGKVLESGASMLIQCVLTLLEKHQTVRVWNVRGNHDRDASLALSLAMKYYFMNEPRVIVDTGPSLYKYHRHGKTLIGSHHGHGAKAADLPLLMATDRKEDWAATEHRVWHCGHIHHRTAKEYAGCTVETHRTLAPQDAWAAGKGYRARRDMNAIVYHREFGEIQRSRYDIAMAEPAVTA